MLNYIQSLPEATAWTKFDPWFQCFESADTQAMMQITRTFTAEDRAYLLRILRAIHANLSTSPPYGNITLPQYDVLQICRFVCYEKSDLRKEWKRLKYLLPECTLVLELLPIYTPSWFDEVYNHHLRGLDCNYETGIALERMGFPVLNPAHVGMKLSYFIAECPQDDMETQYKAYPEIFARDIWALFSEKALPLGCGASPFFTADYRKRWKPLWDEYEKKYSYDEARAKAIEILGPPEYEPFSSRGRAVVDGINSHKLERSRVLRECLLGICRNLDKEQITGFSDFFTVLKPSQQELLELQDELIAVMGCRHSKPITTILKHLKTIITHKNCNYEAVIQALPVVLCSNVKSLYTMALSIAEELAKHTVAARYALVHAVTVIFNPPDEATQMRVAKFLNTYADTSDKALRADIAQWQPNLTLGALALLGNFMDDTVDRADKTEAKPLSDKPRYLDKDVRGRLPKKLEELLFFLTDVFAHLTIHAYSSLPDALLALRNELDDASLHLLGPAIKKAREWVRNSDNTLALYFLRYCIARLEAAQGENIEKLKKDLPEMRAEVATRLSDHVFCSFDDVVEAAFARLYTGDPLPMLSTVTHAPHWLDPLELIVRLQQWQKAGREPHTMDMQLAIQRCARVNTAAALSAARALEGEYHELIEYFLSDNPALPSKITHKAWWITAALMRPERRVPQEFLGPEFAAIPPEYFGAPFQWKILPITDDVLRVLPSWYFGRRVYIDGPNGEQELTTTFEQWLTIPLAHEKYAREYLIATNTNVEKVDIGKCYDLFCGRMMLAKTPYKLYEVLQLYPNNPEPLVMDFIAAYRREKYNEVLLFLDNLINLSVPMGPASHLLLALCFFAGIKNPRLHAAAFWRTKVEDGHIDCAELGRLLGQLEAHKWVPTKRFTDIVEKELLAVSPLHSAQLATMLEAMLLELGPEPPVAIKRILELYYELTAAQGKKLPAPMLPLLDAWATEKSQAAIIKKLRTLG